MICKIRHSSCQHGFRIKEALIKLSHTPTLLTHIYETVTGTNAMEEKHRAFKEAMRWHLTWSGRSGMASSRNGCLKCDLKGQSE